MHASTRSVTMRPKPHSFALLIFPPSEQDEMKRGKSRKRCVWERLGCSESVYVYEDENGIVIVMAEYGRLVRVGFPHLTKFCAAGGRRMIVADR